MPLPPIPWKVPIAETFGALLTGRANWGAWFLALHNAVDAAAQRTGHALGLTTQAASLAATTLVPVPATGLYRITYYARITRAATTSSSLTVTVRWTDGGIAVARSGAAITGNTTATVQADSLLVQADQGTLLTIETTYASVGATTMQYALSARVEAMP
jgi:hypothetical protein